MEEMQYVVFNLNDKEFGINIMKVKEIISYKEPTYVPNFPDFIEGVLNYRGTVIPLINLKKRFEMENVKAKEDSRIIVINYNNNDIGFIIDDATQTIKLEKSSIEPLPDVIDTISRRFISGVGKINENRLLIILNLHNVLTDKEKAEIAEMDI